MAFFSIFKEIVFKLIPPCGQWLHKREDRRRYEETLARELGSVFVLGSPDIERMPVDLLSTFVSLNVSPRPRSTHPSEEDFINMRQEFGEDLNADGVFAEAFRQSQTLVILGDPGSGKTTLLKYYVMSCLKGTYQRYDLLPIYLPLRQVQFQDIDSSPSPFPIHKNLSYWAEQHGLEISETTFSDWLNSRNTLVLLDGLDEIPDAEKRRAVCEWIAQSANGLSRARFIVTSRGTGYRKTDGIELSCEHYLAEINDFSPAQQADYLRRWFKAVHDIETVTDPKKVTELPEDLQPAETVIAFLNKAENKAIRELAAVPMLLQIIAIMWKERKFLPHARSGLFRASVAYVLDFRDRQRGLSPRMPAESAIRVLPPVAYWMHSQEDNEKSRGGKIRFGKQTFIPTYKHRSTR